MKSLEKEIDGANSRAQKAEKALEALRQRQSETEEGQAQSEIIRLKHKLIEVESQLERERAAKDECIAEQEQYRLAAHKLVSLAVNFVTYGDATTSHVLNTYQSLTKNRIFTRQN